MHSPHRKKPRYSAPVSSTSFSSVHLSHKIPKKKPPQIIHSLRHSNPSSSHKQQSNNSKFRKVNNSQQHPQQQHPTPMSIADYRPKAIYSSMIPVQSSADIIKTHQDPLSNVINFSCINYASLMEYCEYFKLHDFEYDYHYDLASRSASSYQFASNAAAVPPLATQSCSLLLGHRKKEPTNTANNADIADKHHDENNTESKNSAGKHVQRVGARMASSKREMDDDDEDMNDTQQDDDLMSSNSKNSSKPRSEKKRGKKEKSKKNAKAKSNEIEHLYFNADVLDRHYCKKKRQRIPATLDPATRLTKTELVEIVKEHFLSQPLLKDLSEYDVVKQFLLYIQDRRNVLKKDMGFE